MLSNFALYMPTDLPEACRLKAEGAKPVAGGTDVYVNMHSGKDKTERVVDLKGIPELQGQRYVPGQGLDLGALTSHRRIEAWDLIRRRYYALFQGCSQVGSVQIRYRGTLGGNIMNGAPSADSIGPLLVHDTAVVTAGPEGERTVPLEQFYVGFKKFDLRPDELLKRILVPDPPDNAGSAYYKYMRRNAMDLALMDRDWVNTWATDVNALTLDGAYSNGDGTFDILVTMDVYEKSAYWNYDASGLQLRITVVEAPETSLGFLAVATY